MWRYFYRTLNGGLPIDTESSFYCGNDAGRPATAIKEDDRSDRDYFFAKNTSLYFHTPESLFLGEPLGLPQPNPEPERKPPTPSKMQTNKETFKKVKAMQR